MEVRYSEISEGPETIGLAQLCDTAITGDVLLFEGNATSSSLIRLAPLSEKWSHVALVVGHENGTYLYESTIGGDQIDEITHRSKNGPRIIDLRTRLNTYDGKSISYRRIYYKDQEDNWIRPNTKLRNYWTTKIWDFARHTNPTSTYEFNFFELIGSTMRANQRDGKNYFCVELTAESLEVAGILTKSHSPNNYTLYDFSELGFLPMEPGLKYSDEISLKTR